MTTAPSPAPPGMRQFSATVEGALAEVGPGPVRCAEVIDRILARHLGDSDGEYLQTGPVRQAWADRDVQIEIEGSIRQPPQQWKTELERLIVPGQRVNGQIAILALALTDQLVARAAQNTGLLYAIAMEIQPDAVTLLTDLGLGLLRKRAPMAAFGLGVLQPVLELNSHEVGRDIVIAVAPPTGLPPNQVGQWATSSDGRVLVGRGGQSRYYDELGPAVALGWSKPGVLGVLHDTASTDASTDATTFTRTLITDEVTAPDVRAGTEETSWPRVTSGQVAGPGAIGLAPGGELFFGDTSPVPIGDPGVSYTAACLERENNGDARVAALDANGQLSTKFPDNSHQPFTYSRPYQPGTLIAADGTYVYLVESGGTLSAVPWLEGQEERILLPFTTKWERLSAARQVAALADSNTICLASASGLLAMREFGARILGMDLSPDGTVLAIESDDRKLRMWRLDAVDDLSLTAYGNDNPEGPDLLGIEPTVDALAALICAKLVQPPLSVGLFGMWGSGKSFFMRKLQARVDEIVEDAKESGRVQRALWTWRNVSQVRFNAWDYSSGDIWAGLLEKLIQELAAPREGKLELPRELDDIKRQRLQSLVVTTSEFEQVSTERDAAQKALEQAQKAAVDAQNALKAQELEAAAAIEDAATSAARQALIKAADGVLEPLGLGAAASAVEDVRIQLSAARERLQSVSGLVRSNNGWLIVLTLVLSPVVALALGIAVRELEPSLAGVAVGVGGIATLLGGLATWLRKSVAWIDEQLEPIRKAEAEAARIHAKLTEDAAAADRAQALAAAAVTAAQVEVAERQRKLDEAEKAARGATAGNLLNEYLVTRSRSDDYRSRLGVIGLVRADIETVSDAVMMHNNEVLADGYNDLDDVVNRVVLYIDDLDRCRPEVVVKVLEAVHLLLSYPLFAVVVGVDASWVARSLGSVYPKMLTGGEVTTDHYLEKIFQLPVWLDSPGVSDAKKMLAALLGHARADGPSPVTGPSEAAPELAAADSGVPVGSVGNGPASGLTPIRGTADLATSEPRALRLSDDERRSINALAGLLVRSPRALKRYVNTYHLLKVIEGDPTELVRVRILLAIAVGRPVLGERLLVEILQSPDDKALPQLAEEWPVSEGDWLKQGMGVTTGVWGDWSRMTCGNSKRAAAHVHRFVYRSLLQQPGPAGA